MAAARDVIREAYGLVELAGVLADAVGTAATLTGPRGGPRALRRAVGDACAALAAHPPPGPWGAPAAAAARSALRLSARAGAGGPAVDASHAALKAVRLAHDILSGAPVPPSEILAVVRSWDRHHPVPGTVVDAFLAVAAESVAAPAGGEAIRGGPVYAAFGWTARKPGSVARERRMGTVPVRLRDLGRDAWPALRLVPGKGEAFDLLACEGALYRPVFSPGSWEPLRVGRLARAASGAEAWVDAPHHGPVAGGGVVLPLADACAPDVVETPGQGSARADAAREAVARAGRLAVHGGVVHREVGAPWLTVGRGDGWDFTWRDPTTELHLGWRFPDGLASDIDMATACRVHVPGVATLDGVSFPAGLGDQAVAALEAWVAAEAASRASRFRTSVRRDVPVEVLDAEAFPCVAADLAAAGRHVPDGPLGNASHGGAHPALPSGAALGRHIRVLADGMDAAAADLAAGMAGFRP